MGADHVKLLVLRHHRGMVRQFTRKASETAQRANMAAADGWCAKVVSADLRGKGFLTYAEQAEEMNRLGQLSRRAKAWTAQSVYLCCPRAGYYASPVISRDP